MITNKDIYFASYALELAHRDTDKTAPNPNVGAVLVKNDIIVGYGNHKMYGGRHAEINALDMAGDNAFGATCYVTLEPCGHHGRTPPCADALVKANISRVVYISDDPNPLVCGKGLEIMRKRGILIEKCAALEHLEHELNKAWRHYIVHRTPYVTLKMGISINEATVNPKTQWITSEEARADVQKLRGEHDAILTTADTVIADNPELTYRLNTRGKQPIRIVLDAKLRTTPDAKIYNIPFGQTILATKEGRDVSGFKRENVITYFDKSAGEHIDVKGLLSYLAEELSVTSLLIEAGHHFANTILDAELINELCLYTSPMIINEGESSKMLLDNIFTSQLICDVKTEFIGDNLKVTGKLMETSKNLVLSDRSKSVS